MRLNFVTFFCLYLARFNTLVGKTGTIPAASGTALELGWEDMKNKNGLDIGIWVVLFISTLGISACHKDESRRVAIKKGAKAGLTSSELLPQKADHVDLTASRALLKSASDEASRFFTESVIVAEADHTTRPLANENIRAMAQILNAGQATRLFFLTNTVAANLDSDEGKDLLNVVAQTEDSVTFQAADNSLRVFKITSKKKAAQMVELQSDSENRLYQFLGPQNIRITRKVPLSNFDYCGTSRNLTVSTIYRFETLNGEQSEIRVNGALLQVFANHLNVTDKMKSLLAPSKEAQNKNGQANKAKLRERGSPLAGRIDLPTDLLQLLIKQAAPGQFIHLECKSP